MKGVRTRGCVGSLPGIVFFGKMCIKQVLKNRIILKQFSEAVNANAARKKHFC